MTPNEFNDGNWTRKLPIRCVMLGILFLSARIAVAQNEPSPDPPTADDSAPAEADEAILNDAELDTLVAPIALYPDVLIAQILPASTYPLELVQAARALKDAGGKVDEETIKSAEFDVSVCALMNFPSVLGKMNAQLEWTQNLGNAFIAQQEDVLASIQRLRTQAVAAGSLQSDDKYTVVTQDQNLQIVPAEPNVVYVPEYTPQAVVVEDNSNAVAWGAVGFAAGVAVGDWLSDDVYWGGGYIGIDVDARRRYWGRAYTGWGASARWSHNAARRTGYRRGAGAGYRQGARTGATAGAAPARRARASSSSRRSSTAGSRPGNRPAAKSGAATASNRNAYAGRSKGSTARHNSNRGAASRNTGKPRYATSAGGRNKSSAAGRSKSNAFSGQRSGSHAREQSARGSGSRSHGGRSGGGRRGGGRRR